MLRRSVVGVLAAALISAVATALITFIPGLQFAYRQHDLHIGFETAAALIGLLATFLLFGRFRRSRRLEDLDLFFALALFAFSNLFLAALPAMLTGAPPGAFPTWAALVGRLLGTMALAAAAFAPRRWLRVSTRTDVVALVWPFAVLAVTAILIGLLAPGLPTGVEAQLSPEESRRPRLVGHPAVLAVQLGSMVLFAVAALGFLWRSRRRGDELMGWLAIASVFGAFARLNYFLYPSLYTEWVYSGDAFRLLFYAVVLVAALREIASYRQDASQAAVLGERGRIARDLHDGLAQELAYVCRNLKRLDGDDPFVARASRGAERALAEARRAIAVLSDDLEQPVDVALTNAARSVAEREGAAVSLALATDVRVAPEQREALIRIASEAITNAVRHGGADLVRVELEGGTRTRLRIIDMGTGFDPEALETRASDRFGLVSMRERALALGGELTVTSRPGRGAEVEVVL